jgi:putative tricarboxylic transport membrane protein
VKVNDTLVGAGFVAAGALIYVGTLTYPSLEGGHPGPSLFPRIIAALMAGLGGLVSLRGVRAGDVTDQVAWRRLHRSAGFINAVCVLAGVLAYVLLAERLGFLLIGTLVTFGLMWRLGVRLLQALVVAAALSVLVYALFAKILRVPLPLGFLWW